MRTVVLVSKKCIVFVLIILLTSCLNSERFVSIEKRGVPKWQANATTTQPVATSRPSSYRVKRGDTLYSIAFRFGLNYKKLAAANGIGNDYKIYQGQRLSLKEASLVSSRSVPKSTQSSNSNTDSRRSQSASQKSDTATVVAKPVAQVYIDWSWPHDGKIVRTFDPDQSAQKGIDIAGRIGDSVAAAAEGTVVYAGDGLAGYGNLIIVEHEGSFLSAYAFAEEILVKEKESVTAGQTIATMGNQGDQAGLHFEIRREGTPVNPTIYLPKR
ncbi:peptidoglycan DD-metalloendopeptidase family protein [Reinekea thalattae]|uniref:Peptidoglycan DD-metalloendopeptidase family protein n=1 Tax=Reinekea thalattae TaxID=2593301 RepID=A0A5C8ZA62_9GAMM|nr:peptidoglycan DD-metalloendopeptidase family protein [Reinekea thalattae]TXR54058.1 peptidoglycan DD-metalloendopeptidase family protein [Reinekea thalattae]